MKDTAAARRYAKAFAATFGDPAALEKAVAELAGFAGVVEQSRELRSVMQNPAVGEAAKTAILDEVLTRMGASATTATTTASALRRARSSRYTWSARGWGSVTAGPGSGTRAATR